MPGEAELLSLVIPVYKNEENLGRLLPAVVKLGQELPVRLEVIFVVDGSPDRSYEILEQRLPALGLRAQLLQLSRNFGSFSAIAAGMSAGAGDYFAVIAADLQEPPELVIQFAEVLRRGEADIVFGVRARRADPWLSELASNLFWGLYRRFVVRDMPPGGVDVFGCTRGVRDCILGLREVNTNLIALLFWVGFRRRYIAYERQARQEGRSAWTLKKKLRYSLDSIFNFTDLPLRLLMYAGILGMSFAIVFGIVLIVARLTGHIPVLGYTPIVLTIMFFGGLTSAAFGIVGQYLWLALQNARQRPNFIVASTRAYGREPH